MNHLLTILLAIPLVGAVLCAVAPDGKGGRLWALVTALLTLGLSAFAALRFNWNSGEVQFGQTLGSVTLLRTEMSARIGVDGISLLLVMLTALLTALAVLGGWASVGSASEGDGPLRGRSKEHSAWVCVSLFAMLGVWVARDLLLFYAFFELTLVPLFFLVGVFGGEERRRAAAELFIYAFTGSILALPAILYLGLSAGTFDLAAATTYAQTVLTGTQRFWVLLGLLASFCVKTPLFPLHTWLAPAHGEGPGWASSDVPGLVIKLGAYAMMRIALPIGVLSPTGTLAGGHVPTVVAVLGVLSVIGILYGALVAWAQTDMKRLLAYSSMSHVAFVILGLLSLNPIGMRGAVLYIINTAISTGALFLVVGMIHARTQSRDMGEVSGLGRSMPVLSFFMILFVMASAGLPALNGFVGEFMTLQGAFVSPHLGMGYAIPAALGMVLGAVYLLHMTARVVFGAARMPAPAGAPMRGDLTLREIMTLAPLGVLVVVLGLMPNGVLRTIGVSLDAQVSPPPAVVMTAQGVGNG